MNFHRVSPSDNEIIQLLAQWYFEEWAVPIENTIKRLTEQLPTDIIFHVVLKQENKIIATGGLHLNAGLMKVYSEYEKFGPWVSMIYTTKIFRRQGFGQLMLAEIEKRSKEHGYSKLYLFTNSAEEIYRKNGWQVVDRILYKEKDTVVMNKEI